MKKLVMMAVLSGMVLECFGCPCRQIDHYTKMGMEGSEPVIEYRSCTGIERTTTLNEAAAYNSLNEVTQLLAAGARDYDWIAYSLADFKGYKEVAKLIQASEAKYGHKEPKFNSKALEISKLASIEGVTGLTQTEGRTACTCLSGCIANGISYADVEYIKELLEYGDPTESLTAEAVHNFVERAKQLGNPEITKLIEQAPIIGPKGLSYEEYLQMKDKQTTTPEQDPSND